MTKTKETFEWAPLSSRWQRLLMSDKFFIKNCKGDGNCQFRSVQTALEDESGLKINHRDLRNLVGRYVMYMPDSEFEHILLNYRLEYDYGNFQGDWNPYEIRTKSEFADVIVKPGFTFQGDDVTLTLLSQVLQIDFVLFDDRYNILNLSDPRRLHDNIIILFRNVTNNGNGGHYQTIGLNKSHKIQTLFNRGDLPKQVHLILDKDILLERHVHNYIQTMSQTPNRNKYKPFDENDVLTYFETVYGRKATDHETWVIRNVLASLQKGSIVISNQNKKTEIPEVLHTPFDSNNGFAKKRSVNTEYSYSYYKSKSPPPYNKQREENNAPSKRKSTRKNGSKRTSHKSSKRKTSTKAKRSKRKGTKKSIKRKSTRRKASTKAKRSKRKGARNSKRKSTKRKTSTKDKRSKRKSPRRSKRKSTKRKSATKDKRSKRKSPRRSKRKTTKRKSASKATRSKRKGAKKSSKRKTTKRKSATKGKRSKRKTSKKVKSHKRK